MPPAPTPMWWGTPPRARPSPWSMRRSWPRPPGGPPPPLLEGPPRCSRSAPQPPTIGWTSGGGIGHRQRRLLVHCGGVTESAESADHRLIQYAPASHPGNPLTMIDRGPVAGVASLGVGAGPSGTQTVALATPGEIRVFPAAKGSAPVSLAVPDLGATTQIVPVSGAIGQVLFAYQASGRWSLVGADPATARLIGPVSLQGVPAPARSCGRRRSTAAASTPWPTHSRHNLDSFASTRDPVSRRRSPACPTTPWSVRARHRPPFSRPR